VKTAVVASTLIALIILLGPAIAACGGGEVPITKAEDKYPPVVAKRKPFVAIGDVSLSGYQITLVKPYGAGASLLCISDGNCYYAAGDAGEIASLIAGQLP
jgi:hypothetical protein